MVESVGGKDEKFYNALKNSQPLAFLASVSMGIAILIHSTTQQFAIIYNYAIIAGSMFLFSFIASLFYQLILVSEDTKQYVRWSQYVFLALGILYLLLILLNFSQSIPQIIELVFAWVFFVAGISYIIPLKRRWRILKTKKGNIIQTSIIISMMFAMSALLFINSFMPELFPKIK